MYKKHLTILSVLISFVVVCFFFYNRNQISEIILQVNICWAIAGCGAYLLNYVFRGIRLRLLAGSKISFFHEAFYFSTLHGFLSYLLPLRTGDVSLPVLLKSTGKLNLRQGVGVLVKARLLDLSMLGMLTVFGSFWGARMISPTIQIVWGGAGMILASSFFIVQKIGRTGDGWLKQRFNIDTGPLLRLTWMDFWVTFFVWISVYACQYCMVKSIGLDLTLSEIVFISAIQFPLQLLPVQGLANSGNHEGGWISSMLLMGFSADVALGYAIASHGVLILYVAILGLFAMVIGGRKVVPFLKD